MSDNPVVRDERAVAVENTSYRWAYQVLSFGVLLSVAVRGLLLKEASWDLLALVIVASAVATFYQATRRTLPQHWAKAAILFGLIGAVLAAILAVAAMLQH